MVLTIEKTSFFSIFAICHFTWWFILLSFKNYPNFDHQINLPHVCSHLYWSFNPVNSTLSVNFQTSSATDGVAPPSTGGNGSNTWVAWGINPINSSGSCSIDTQIAQITQVVVFSVDAQRSLVVEKYNFSLNDDAAAMDDGESGTIWGVDVVGIKSSFDFGLIKFEAEIALPEKSETVTQLVMIGSNGDGGNPDLHDADFEFFEVLNLAKAKQSTLSKFVDGLSRAFSFKRGCSREIKTIWGDSLTLDNFQVACNYGMIMTLLSWVEVKENKLYWTCWKLFGVVVVIISLSFMYISLAIKANGVLEISVWKSFSSQYCAYNTAAALITTLMFVALHKKRANSYHLARCRETVRLLTETHYSLTKLYKTRQVSSRTSKWYD